MKYEINGHVVEAEGQLSEHEIDDIASSLGAPKQSNTPSQESSPFGQVAKDALHMALPSPDYNKPLEPTSGNPIKGALQAAGQTLRDPTRISPTLSEPGQVAGNAVEAKTGSKLAGFATSQVLDPQSYIGGTELVKSAFTGARKAGNSILKTVMKIGANVSDASIEQGAKAGWKLPNVSAPEIETAVANVQNVLKDSVESAGKILNEAKSQIGLPTTVAEKEAAIAKHGNPFGIGKADMETGALTEYLKPSKSPEELVTTIKNFKETSKGLARNSKAKVATYLQDQVNKFVDWEKSGNQVEGVLKQQYKQLGDVVQSALPKEIRERMSSALSLKDDLERQLGLLETEGTGKAEQFLRNLFEAKTAKSKDYLKRFADLETLTGQPVLQELFKKFAGQDLHKLAGRPFLAGISAAGVASGHPGAVIPLVGQSPRFLNALGKAGSSAANMAEKASNIPARALRGFMLSDHNRHELDKTLARLKNAQ